MHTKHMRVSFAVLVQRMCRKVQQPHQRGAADRSLLPARAEAAGAATSPAVAQALAGRPEHACLCGSHGTAVLHHPARSSHNTQV